MSNSVVALGVASIGFLFFFGGLMLKLRRETRRAADSEARAESERNKRLAAEARESERIDALHAAKMAYQKKEERMESYIKAQQDALNEHGINLVLERDPDGWS